MIKINTSWFFFILIIASAIGRNGCEAQDDEEIGFYILQKGNFTVRITNYGATVLNVIVPDKHGKLNDIVLGFESIDGYKNDSTYFGALVGRVANRIGGAQFTLHGKKYQLPANDHGINTLHGGTKGFSDVIWTVQQYIRDSYITLTYDSYDGEQGFPGAVSVSVTYMFVGTNMLAIRIEAKPLDMPTPINLASHTYWNLGGQNSGDILSHKIKIYGSFITPVDDKLIPTGEITPVKGTAYDFLKPRTIGSRINELPDGYDINYIINHPKFKKHLSKVAHVRDRKSGRNLEMWSNQPGVQFYTSNMLDNVRGKGGFVYKKYAALCLESQGFPDAVNHPNFPSQIVNPGEVYKHTILYRFTA